MTDIITTELENTTNIVKATSYPTGLRNNGPDEYCIKYTPDSINKQELINTLKTLVTEHTGVGFHLEHFVEASSDSNINQLIASVHYHPLSGHLQDFFDDTDLTNEHDINWDVDNIWNSYDDSAQISLTNLASLDVSFKADYPNENALLHILETTLNQWEKETGYNIFFRCDGVDGETRHISIFCSPQENTTNTANTASE